jgi:hypothetical protein
MPAAGGTPVRVLDGVLFGNFDVVHGGIYYLERVSGNPADNQRGGAASQDSEIRLQYFDVSTNRSTTIAPSLGKAGHGLSVSQDGRSIFFARVDSAIDELMLVDGFR